MTTNEKIAHIFHEMALFLEMQDVQFKPRAYERAAAEIAAYPEDLRVLYKKGGRAALDAIPGVGAHMAEKIEQFLKTKKIAEYEQMKKHMPVRMSELSQIEGVGPKTIATLYKKLRVTTRAQLLAAARAHKVRAVPGLGEKTEENVLRNIAFLKISGARRIRGYVEPEALRIESYLRTIPGVQHAVIAGSLRRKQETIGDIDLLVTAKNPTLVEKKFLAMPGVRRVLAHGKGLSSVRLANGMQCDIRVVHERTFGAALVHFTGSKEHNVLLRKRAIEHGMKLSEYGLTKGTRVIPTHTEEEVYHALGLDFIPPELRVGHDEIDAAAAHKLPQLLAYNSVRGDLQVQTSWTDGTTSITDMAAAAMKLGREYIAITDHTQALAMTGGLDEAGLAKQGKEIDHLNAAYKRARKKFRILKGAEVNILKDGTLDISDAALAKLEVVGVSVHSHFHLSRAEQTARIITALKNPHVDILFHPTGRIINHRPAYDVDMPAIIAAAKKYGVALEINAYPDRTDLRDEHIRMAVRAGVKLVVNTDAHAPEHLKFISLGEGTARRGWATAADILNTKSVAQVLKFFA